VVELTHNEDEFILHAQKALHVYLSLVR
jgi:hypothetical protein